MKKPMTPEQRRRRRNRLQRARRASPEARAAEARASRVSYWRRKTDYRVSCSCKMCEDLRAEHGLGPRAERPAPSEGGGCGCGG
jgi:hypothetical protein